MYGSPPYLPFVSWILYAESCQEKGVIIKNVYPPSSVALFVKTNVSLAKFFARLRREECVFHNL